MLIAILILLSLNFVLPEGNVVEAQQPSSSSPPPPPHLPPGKPHQRPYYPQPVSPPTSLGDYYPFNVSISHHTPRAIEISWSCKDNSLSDRYEVTIKPVLASYKVVETVPNNMCSLIMDKLEPDTTYQVSVTAIAGRNRKRSGYVIFRTFMEDDYSEFSEDLPFYGDGSLSSGGGDAPSASPEDSGKDGRLRLPRVRLVEISLVGMALVLWAGAIVLFFHRWGKIRMLLPYQPDYKEMKNNNASCTTCSLTPHHQCQKIHHIPNPVSGECCPTQAITTTYHHHLQQPPQRPRTPHLPHQPLSEPGPSHYLGHNVVTVTESGCSPIRQNIPSFNEGDICIDMSLPRHYILNSIQRKSWSAEQLKQYVFPWEEPQQHHELECTEF